MSNKNTLLFAASLLVATGAVAVDYAVSDAPAPAVALQADSNPCAAGVPAAPRLPGQRNYDDIADGYSGGPGAVAPAPAPAPGAADMNPCSAGLL